MAMLARLLAPQMLLAEVGSEIPSHPTLLHMILLVMWIKISPHMTISFALRDKIAKKLSINHSLTLLHLKSSNDVGQTKHDLSKWINWCTFACKAWNSAPTPTSMRPLLVFYKKETMLSRGTVTVLDKLHEEYQVCWKRGPTVYSNLEIGFRIWRGGGRGRG